MEERRSQQLHNQAPSEPVKSALTPAYRYLSPSQVAELFAVNRSTIGRWAASDSTMPATRVGGVVRFRSDLIEAWLAGKTQGATRAQRRRTER